MMESLGGEVSFKESCVKSTLLSIGLLDLA